MGLVYNGTVLVPDIRVINKGASTDQQFYFGSGYSGSGSSAKASTFCLPLYGDDISLTSYTDIPSSEYQSCMRYSYLQLDPGAYIINLSINYEKGDVTYGICHVNDEYASNITKICEVQATNKYSNIFFAEITEKYDMSFWKRTTPGGQSYTNYYAGTLALFIQNSSTEINYLGLKSISIMGPL